MKYERLTKSLAGICFCNNSVDCKIPCHECYYKKVYDLLAELEDKIENGTLIELPCIMQDCYGDWRIWDLKVINSESFLTEEEAEAKLKELKGEEK